MDQSALLRLAFASLLILPLLLLAFSTSKCSVPAWESHSDFHVAASSQDFFLGVHSKIPTAPIFGYVINAFVAAWLLGLVTAKRARFVAGSRIHRFAFLYGIVAIAQAVSYFANPLLFLLCPSNMPVFWATCSGLNALLFVLSVVSLLVIALERLRLVSAVEAARRGSRLLPAFFAASVVVIASTIARNMTLSYVWLAIMIAAIVAMCALYLAFQVNAYIGLRRAATEAIAEATREGQAGATARYRRAMDVALALAVAASTSIALGLSYSVRHLHPAMSWLMQAVYALDFWSNSLLAMLAADVIKFREADQELAPVFKSIGDVAGQQRQQLGEGDAAAITPNTLGVVADDLPQDMTDQQRQEAIAARVSL